MIPGSTTTLSRTSLSRRFDSCCWTRSRSARSSSIAVVTVALTRPAASSASRSNSSSIARASPIRFDSMRSLARLVPSGSSTCGADATRASRRSAGIVGLRKTAATSGSSNSSVTLASRRDHASISPAGWASSKMAFAYRLAAAVATRHFLDRALDQLLVLGSVERLPDHFLRRRNHQAGDLVARRLDRTLALGLDITSGALDEALVLGFGLLAELLPELLAGAVRPLDDGLGSAPGFDQLLIRLFQAS